MTYLELSEDGGGAHKFYEVIVSTGPQVTITLRPDRRERPDQGRRVRRPGQGRRPRPRRRSARRSARATRPPYGACASAARSPGAAIVSSPLHRHSRRPVLWRFDSGAAAFGIFVDEERCWVGNQHGDVYTVTHDGTVTGRFRLPDGREVHRRRRLLDLRGLRRRQGLRPLRQGPAGSRTRSPRTSTSTGWTSTTASSASPTRAGRITTIDHEDEFQWARTGQGRLGLDGPLRRRRPSTTATPRA